MLKDMGHTGGVFRNGFKGNAKRIFSIAVADVDMFGTGARMLQFIENRGNLFKGFNAFDSVIIDTLAGFEAWIVGI